jgi:hypothetical protein
MLPKFRLNKKFFSFLIISAVFFWLLTVFTTHVSDISVDAQFGLMQYMPWYFWLGVCLIGITNILAILGHGSKKTQFLSLVITVLFVWGTPCFVVPTVGGDTYWHASTAMLLQQNGYVDSSIASYLAWPTVFIMGATFTSITTVIFSQFIQYYPFLNSFILMMGFYLLSRRLLKLISWHLPRRYYDSGSNVYSVALFTVRFCFFAFSTYTLLFAF